MEYAGNILFKILYFSDLGKIMEIQIKNYLVHIFHEEHHETIIIWFSGKHEDNIISYVKRNIDCMLVVVTIENWNDQLSPWQASVFKDNDFAGHGYQTYQDIVDDLLPFLKKNYSFEKIYLAGYSLAGLFVLYVLYLNQLFSGGICCSGSLWYPGFVDFLNEYPVLNKKIYLSLGNKEHRNTHPLLSTVKQKTEDIFRFYQKYNDCIYQIEQGNHFQNVEKRIVSGMKWIVKEDK